MIEPASFQNQSIKIQNAKNVSVYLAGGAFQNVLRVHNSKSSYIFMSE